MAVFEYLAEGEDVVDATSIRAKTCLLLAVSDLTGRGQSLKKDGSQQL
jgi:hypothetical protein